MVKEIASRFREVFLDGTWVANTNYKKVLTNITWQEAKQKEFSANTIALLTFHVNYYVAGVLQVFEGGTLDIKDKFSFDAPEITSEKDWEILRNTLFENSKKLANCIEQLSKKELESIFVDEKYGSHYRNIEGIIEHSYYHLGQISLIKKMIDKTEN
ncbi:hypothetical protein OD91_1332 [Lutibacter sp. Hel_I_33_5]|uniref:DinB family protein n=1 Tax=Lutibacter sp. Hel_I_33_5 TaxID=1566289 RepID=UPI00119F1DC2|nr:DinB family protein [Lutibacter sp. Hel_I_33_5]TVZ56053.1 hypothetical protein OD91_1332 [Lutibacter sp. Hel_I_33_5]